MLILGRACVSALVTLSLDILDGQRAVRDTLSHVCGELDIILTCLNEEKMGETFN